MQIVLVTGMSGAGKSVALKTLEDAGFEAIDNIPLALIPAAASVGHPARQLAVGADIRSRDFSPQKFLDVIKPLKENPHIDLKIIYLDCDDEVLQRRYTETRRKHPLALDRTIKDGLLQERALIGNLQEYADLVLDTTHMQALELRRIIASHFAGEGGTLTVNITSFSFKRGLPREADMVFDVRFLRNPHYVPELRHLTGAAKEVGEYIENDSDFTPFFTRLGEMIESLLPRYRDEGKSYLTIAIGCTGGRHRSVYITQKLASFLQSKNYNVTTRHRDTDIV